MECGIAGNTRGCLITATPLNLSFLMSTELKQEVLLTLRQRTVASLDLKLASFYPNHLLNNRTSRISFLIYWPSIEFSNLPNTFGMLPLLNTSEFIFYWNIISRLFWRLEFSILRMKILLARFVCFWIRSWKHLCIFMATV